MAQNDQLEKDESKVSTGDTAKTAPPSAPGENDLEKKVKEAEQALNKAKDALAAKAAAAQQEKASDGVKSAYAAAKAGLDQTQSGLETFVDDEKSLLTKAVPNAAELVKSVTDSEAKARTPLATALNAAEDAADDRRQALETARMSHDEQKATVTAVERSLSRIRERQSQADRKRLAVSKARDGGEPAFAYWLLEKTLEPLVEGEPEVVDPDALKVSILAARTELVKRENAVRQKEGALEQANRKVEAKRRDLADFDKEAETRIRNQLKTVASSDGAESSTSKS
jgi:hypothetical protein